MKIKTTDSRTQGTAPVSSILDEYKKRLRALPRLTPEEEQRLIRLAAGGDREAAEKLATGNLRLVLSLAGRYLNRGLPVEDLIQEGNIGLLKAAETVDPAMDCSFSAYAARGIRHCMARAIAVQGGASRVRVEAERDARRAHYAQSRLQQELGREPTEAELAERLCMTPGELRGALWEAQPPLALDGPAGRDRDDCLRDTVASGAFESPPEGARLLRLKGELQQALGALTEREREVLELRYGLADGRTMTLREVAERQGLSLRRISQLEEAGLRRLRRPEGGESA